MLFGERERTIDDLVIVVNRYKVKSKYIDITRGHSVLCNPSTLKDRTRKQAMDDFRTHLSRELKDKDSPVRAEMNRLVNMVLRGETVRLGCVCKPKDCHGDIVRERIIKAAKKRKERL